MPSLKVYPTLDLTIYSDNATYNTAATSGTLGTYFTEDSFVQCGQEYIGGAAYRVTQTGMCFDTTSLNLLGNIVIGTPELWVYPYDVYIANTWFAELRIHLVGNSITTADWSSYTLLNNTDRPLLATLYSLDCPNRPDTNQYIKFTSSVNFKGAINTSGLTTFMLSMSTQRTLTSPGTVNKDRFKIKRAGQEFQYYLNIPYYKLTRVHPPRVARI